MQHQYLRKTYSPDRGIDIVVAGAGGTGSQIITGLARMVVALSSLGVPVPNVTVYDPDFIVRREVA